MEAKKEGLAPQDLVEWIPFLQAGARKGDVERVREIAAFIEADSFIQQESCEILREIELSAEMGLLTESLFCGE